MKKGCYKYVNDPGKKPYVLEIIDLKDDKTGFDIGIERKDIKNYITPEFLELLSTYKLSKSWGLPNGKGWLDEPTSLMWAFQIFDTELANDL